MRILGLLAITVRATVDVSAENDPRHHSWFSDVWTSFKDTVSDLFDSFNSDDIVSLDYEDWSFSDTIFNFDDAEQGQS